jgi:hypothetical protein
MKCGDHEFFSVVELVGDGVDEDLRGKHGYLAGFTDRAEEGDAADIRYTVFIYDLGAVMSLREADFRLLGFVDQAGKNKTRAKAGGSGRTFGGATLQ